MKQCIVSMLLALMVNAVCSQELYVFSEPASNMPSKSISFKLTGKHPVASFGAFKQRYQPEVMFGINKNWMVHLSTTLSNYYQKNVLLESGKVYAKYRFYSKDEVHRHFRMAAFADASLTRNPYIYMDANLDGDNDGVQFGLIATKLVNRLAVSGTGSYLQVFRQKGNQFHHDNSSYNFLNYSLSAGYLLLPKEYTDYKQTNVNLYFEMLGMRGLDESDYNVDLAPAVQFIFNSNSKISIGYRFQVAGNMRYRIANNQWLASFEHTIFNAWK